MVLLPFNLLSHPPLLNLFPSRSNSVNGLQDFFDSEALPDDLSDDLYCVTYQLDNHERCIPVLSPFLADSMSCSIISDH